VTVEIVPEPDDAERRAILAALAAEEAERRDDPAWARLERPVHADEEPRDP
jgi:hypothetical protein